MLPGWSHFLHFTSEQRRGILLLIAVLLLLLGGLYWDSLHYGPPASARAQADSLFSVWEEQQRRQDSLFRSRLRPFDPHQVSLRYLQRTGLDAVIAERLGRYREGGGRFYEPRDLLELYGIDTSWYRRVRPYIRLPESGSASSTSASSSETAPQYHWQAFDPNTVSTTALEAMGLADWQAENIQSYRRKYRPFRRDSDLFEVYGLDSSLVRRMLAHARVVPDSIPGDTAGPQAKSDSSPVFNLNSADSLELLQVKGVGAYTAGQILKKRRAWGGFHSLEQLRDIYPIDSSRLEQLRPQLYCDSSYTRHDLNALSLEKMEEIPYLNYSVARSIVGFRNQFRSYEEVGELQNIRMVDSVLFRKIAPYFYVKSEHSSEPKN